MDLDQILRKIISAIKATPDCKHVRFKRGPSSLSIIGKYDDIIHLHVHITAIDIQVFIDAEPYFVNIDSELQKCINDIIDCIRGESVPYDYRDQRAFYIANFPCLAAEVDYGAYYDHDGINEMLNGKWRSIEHVCPKLYYWDLLAFERKVHSALDGSPLPLPIRNEIFSLFAEFNHPNWE